jgi:hypothetical protein
MALLTDDCDIKVNYLRTFTGGNGDYYISIIRNDENGLMHEDCVRVAMSGGFAKTWVKLAVVELFRKEIADLYSEFADGKIIVDFDFEKDEEYF